MSTARRPIIGITPDTHTHKGAWRYEITQHYAQAVEAAGGVPLVLPYQVDSIPAYLHLCEGVILGGGDDPDTQPFGEPVHPAAKRVVPERQAFESKLLAALDATAHPVLGICLGMQWMALHHGGRLHQHLPDLSAEWAAAHEGVEHAVVVEPTHGEPSAWPAEWAEPFDVFSRHHQAVADVGRMRIAARSDAVSGSLIEAIDLPGERFYMGVQWHPERTQHRAGGAAVFEQLVEAARRLATHARPSHVGGE